MAQKKKFFSARPANRNPASGGSNVQVNFIRQPPRAVQFDPFEQPERSSRINVVRQPPRRFSNLGRPLSKVLEKLIEKGMLRPMPSQQPLPNANPKLYCKFYQTIGHDTDVCTRLRHEIQDLIDTGKITDPETRKPNT